MAALFDSTVGVLLLRRRPVREAAPLIRAARAEIKSGSALLPAVSVSELLIGENDPERLAALESILAGIPTVLLPVEAAHLAGTMGAFLRSRGAPIPFPDLLIAATAVWLETPLLTWDSDYHRSFALACDHGSAHPGAEFWRGLLLHPDSRTS